MWPRGFSVLCRGKQLFWYGYERVYCVSILRCSSSSFPRYKTLNILPWDILLNEEIQNLESVVIIVKTSEEILLHLHQFFWVCFFSVEGTRNMVVFFKNIQQMFENEFWYHFISAISVRNMNEKLKPEREKGSFNTHVEIESKGRAKQWWRTLLVFHLQQKSIMPLILTIMRTKPQMLR